MAKEETDYSPAIRREIKADAETGRTIKKWKHRAQGATVGGVGAAAAILGRKPIGKLIKKVSHLSSIDFAGGWTNGKKDPGVDGHFKRNAGKYIGTLVGTPLVGLPVGAVIDRIRKKQNSKKTALSQINFSVGGIGGFQSMLESSLRLRKKHATAWKSMSKDAREKARGELRNHRQVINEHESLADAAHYGTGHMMNALIEHVTELAADDNGKVHGPSGEFQPAAESVNPVSIRRAYSPKHRLTGISPVGKSIRKKIMAAALARVAKTNEL